MRMFLTAFAVVSIAVLTATSAVAQALPSPATQPAAAKTDSITVETGMGNLRVGGGHRHHALSVRRHRVARHQRNHWRNVWVYRAHDRHGYRNYEYVRRKFGGYFARGRADCTCWRGRHSHYWMHARHL